MRRLMAWAVAVGLLWAGGAAALEFEDGFENIAVGAYPSPNGWVALRLGDSAYVTDAAAHTGSNSFWLNSLPIRPRMDYVLLSELPDRLSYQAAVRVDPVYGRCAVVGYMKGYFGAAPMWNYFQIDAVTGQIEFYGAGRVEVGAYAPGEWCVVRADLNYATLTGDLWVNGQLAATGVAITPKDSYQYPLGQVVLDQWGMSAPSNPDFTGYTGNVVYFDDVRLWEPSSVMRVEVDIKPGGNPNPLNPAARGLLPVAILSSPGFDAADIDPTTVEVGGARVATRGRDFRYMAHHEDVNGDGLVDMVVQVEIRDLDPAAVEEGRLLVTGSTYGGVMFEGDDEVVVVPPR